MIFDGKIFILEANKDMVEVFVYVIGIIYNSLIYTSVLQKIPQEEFVKLFS
ncbi:hypothetical protein [Saccharolobus caldissimus]|uniref:hypothetical protein n=1 Tax=Saccharolobus caldissimus TaxID=1702097 RepID=UPI003CD0DF1C